MFHQTIVHTILACNTGRVFQGPMDTNAIVLLGLREKTVKSIPDPLASRILVSMVPLAQKIPRAIINAHVLLDIPEHFVRPN